MMNETGRYLGGLLAAACTACTQPAPPAPTRAEVELALCRDAIRARLFDPGAAQFSGEGLNVAYADERVYHLDVNGKNRMGGYVGAKRVYCHINPAGAVFHVQM